MDYISYKNRVDEAIVLSGYYKTLLRMIEKPRESTVFWPSECSAEIVQNDKFVTLGKCGRAIYYSMQGFKPTANSATANCRFQLGILSEENEIQKCKLISSKVLSGSNVILDLGKINVHGKIDAIIYDNMYDMYDIIEYKSSYGYQLEHQIINKGQYKEAHAMQLGLYMYGIRNFNCLGSIDIPNEKVRSGILMYTDRGSCQNNNDIYVGVNKSTVDGLNYIDVTTSKLTKHNLVAIESIVGKWQTISDCVATGRLPLRDFIVDVNPQIVKEAVDMGKLTKKEGFEMLQPNKKTPATADWQCRYCNYKDACLAGINPIDKDKNKADVIDTIEELKSRFLSTYGIPIDEAAKADTTPEIEVTGE